MKEKLKKNWKIKILLQVRALVSILLRHLLKNGNNTTNFSKEAANFFAKPRMDIEKEIDEYFALRVSYLIKN